MKPMTLLITLFILGISIGFTVGFKSFQNENVQLKFALSSIEIIKNNKQIYLSIKIDDKFIEYDIDSNEIINLPLDLNESTFLNMMKEITIISDSQLPTLVATASLWDLKDLLAKNENKRSTSSKNFYKLRRVLITISGFSIGYFLSKEYVAYDLMNNPIYETINSKNTWHKIETEVYSATLRATLESHNMMDYNPLTYNDLESNFPSLCKSSPKCHIPDDLNNIKLELKTLKENNNDLDEKYDKLFDLSDRLSKVKSNIKAQLLQLDYSGINSEMFINLEKLSGQSIDIIKKRSPVYNFIVLVLFLISVAIFIIGTIMICTSIFQEFGNKKI